MAGYSIFNSIMDIRFCDVILDNGALIPVCMQLTASLVKYQEYTGIAVSFPPFVSPPIILRTSVTRIELESCACMHVDKTLRLKNPGK
jgi:hypothetical protein